ncbi:MAG: magnesium transporter [Nitrospirae bacterium]|nr:magnesium transporter [Nitrospirota bacterium]
MMEPTAVLLPAIREALAAKDFRTLKESLEEILPPDVAEILRQIRTDEQVLLFRLLRKDQAAEVFANLKVEEQKALFEVFTDQGIKAIIEEMNPDDRTELLDELPAGLVRKLLQLLDPGERALAHRLLGYPESSAGRLMTPEFVDLRPEMSVEAALQQIRWTGPDKETIYYAYVIDQGRKLIGFVSLKNLILADPDKPVGDLMKEEVIAVHTLDDQEAVADVIKRYNLLAVPVVDSEERLVGIVTVDDVVDVMEEEATEDIQKMGAIAAAEEGYFQSGFFSLARRRIFWLAALLVTATLSGSIMEHYASAIQAVVILAFFIPMLMNTGGCTGTQSATLIIRGLATGEIALGQVARIILRESAMGVLLGVAMGVLGFLRAVFVPGSDPTLWTTVGLTIIVTVTAANLVGALLPLCAKAFRMDPALISGPLLTTIMDAMTLVLYFEIARRLLHIST